jgi:hypothetical protein
MSIRASYPTRVDHDRDIRTVLIQNGYDTFVSAIVLRQIGANESGVRDITVDIFQQTSLSSPAGILWSFAAHLRRPLEAIELLSFSEQHPDVQFVMPIVAFGSIIELGVVHYVLGLTSWEGKRALRLFPYDTMWPVEYGFAATRK